MRTLKLSASPELRRQLRHEVCRNHDSHFLHRLHCVLLISEGHSCCEVADWFGENSRTIERWVRRLQEHGVEGLKDAEHPGRPTKLTTTQLDDLWEDIESPPWAYGYRHPIWSGRLLAAYVERKFAVKLSVRQCQRLLKSRECCSG